MSRILHHVGRNDFKKTRQRQIGEQKERAAQKLKELQEAEAERKIIEEAAKPFKSDWRLDFLSEAMTTAGMGMVNYPATGNADIVDNATALIGFEGQNAAVSDGTVTLTDDGDNDIANGTHTAFRQAYYTVDGSKSSHLKITISKGGGTSSWTDRGESWDDDVTLVVSDAANFFAPTYHTYNLTSGTHIIKLPGNYKNTRVQVQQFAKLASDGSPGTTGSLKIYNVSFQRRTPVNVFVPLDDPEANSFIRGGLGGSEERRKKLKDMLESGNQWMYIQGLDPSKTSPGDIELASANWPNKNENPPPVYAPWNKGWPSAPGSNRPYEGKPGTPGGSYPMVQSGDIELAASYPKMDPLDKLLKDIDDVDRKFKNKRPGTRPGKGRGMGDTWEGPGKIV